MPLVRISLMRGKPAEFAQQVGAIVYRTMVDTADVPPGDNFQIIAEHDRDHFLYDPTFLAVSRTDGVILIQIALNHGRTVELKKRFYRTLAERLRQDLGVRTGDVFISLVEGAKGNWSFGDGVAQYAD